MIVTHSLGLGGGSIVSLSSSESIQIGPKSAGANPGPACFDRGGLEPTVTDADVALGYIDPDYFLGGRVKLNRDKAISSIKRRVADPMGISLEEAAYLIKETTEKNIQKELLHFLKEKGVEPDTLTDFALVAYGGGGPTRYAGFVGDLKFGQVLTSPYASTFCAFGFSTTDLLHRYSKYGRITLFDGAKYLADYKAFNQTVEQLIDTARRDIKGEGFSPENAAYYLELIGDEDLAEYKVRSDKINLSSEEDVKNLCAQFERPDRQGLAKVTISSIVLNALVSMPHYELNTSPLSGEAPDHALRGERDVFWSPEVGYQKTPIYERGSLVPGNRVIGPAIIQATDTTYVIPANRSFYISEYSHGVLREV